MAALVKITGTLSGVSFTIHKIKYPILKETDRQYVVSTEDGEIKINKDTINVCEHDDCVVGLATIKMSLIALESNDDEATRQVKLLIRNKVITYANAITSLAHVARQNRLIM